MSGGIIGTHPSTDGSPSGPAAAFTQWLQTPCGQYLRAWEADQFADAVADIFGFHALQLGLPAVDTLTANRMPHQWLALDALPGATNPVGALPPAALAASPTPVPTPVPTPDAAPPGQALTPAASAPSFITDFAALPFSESSLDLLTMPHTLELCHDPHAALAEAQRVLVPEGKLVLSCLNPISLWGYRQARIRLYQRLGGQRRFLPDTGEWMAHRRLRDWLRLLNFEVESVRFGCHQPAWARRASFDRGQMIDDWGRRWWPILGGAYLLVATKRVRGTRLIAPAWKPAPAAAPAAVSAAKIMR